jgi:phenylpropionate dioxygenase-like ring-hydroxylating dioxygenase large terminal subunit
MSVIDSGVWYPIAADHDLPHGHIYRTMLGGHDLAVWRGRDGTVQVWDNRCPHRGVRLSLGEVVGDELRCQYHAWRFARNGVCSFIPAQPDRKVPGTIRVGTWPVAEAGGLLWTGRDPVGNPPVLPPGAVVRALAIKRPAAVVAAAAATLPDLALTVQPLDDGTAIARGVATDGDPVRADLALVALRRRLEHAA